MRNVEEFAKRFHEVYERFAPDFGYKTRPETAVAWEKVPRNNQLLMMSVVREVVGPLVIDLAQADHQIETLAINMGSLMRTAQAVLTLVPDDWPRDRSVIWKKNEEGAWHVVLADEGERAGPTVRDHLVLEQVLRAVKKHLGQVTNRFPVPEKQTQNIGKYREQKYSCCQLVSAVNASAFLGGRKVTDEEFEQLVDEVGCRHGSAVDVEKAWEFLGLEVERLCPFTQDPVSTYEWIKQRLPVEVGYFDCEYGLHSALIVGTQSWLSRATKNLEIDPQPGTPPSMDLEIINTGRWISSWGHLWGLLRGPMRSFRLEAEAR